MKLLNLVVAQENIVGIPSIASSATTWGSIKTYLKALK
tara:strand:+ start:3540 stop:3653 length:114 start_codon:yes stop_codon:yes gene_type:complete